MIDAQTRMFALNSYWFLTSITYTRARHANSNYTSTAAITQLSQRCKLERNQDIAVLSLGNSRYRNLIYIVVQPSAIQSPDPYR